MPSSLNRSLSSTDSEAEFIGRCDGVMQSLQKLSARSNAMGISTERKYKAALRTHQRKIEGAAPEVTMCPSEIGANERFLLRIPVWRAAQAFEIVNGPQKKAGKAVQRFGDFVSEWNNDEFIRRLDGKKKFHEAAFYRPSTASYRTASQLKRRKVYAGMAPSDNPHTQLRHLVRVNMMLGGNW